MDWIEKYEKTTKDYRLTKTKSVNSVKLSFIYTVDTSLPIVNESVKNLEIKDIVNVNYTLKEPSVLSKDELLELLIKYKKTYNSFKIMQFNINSEDHDEFMVDDETDFSSQLNGVNTIVFDDTLGIFDDYTTVYIMFLRRVKNKKTLKNIHLKGRRKTKRSFNFE